MLLADLGTGKQERQPECHKIGESGQIATIDVHDVDVALVGLSNLWRSADKGKASSCISCAAQKG